MEEGNTILALWAGKGREEMGRNKREDWPWTKSKGGWWKAGWHAETTQAPI